MNKQVKQYGKIIGPVILFWAAFAGATWHVSQNEYQATRSASVQNTAITTPQTTSDSRHTSENIQQANNNLDNPVEASDKIWADNFDSIIASLTKKQILPTDKSGPESIAVSSQTTITIPSNSSSTSGGTGGKTATSSSGSGSGTGTASSSEGDGNRSDTPKQSQASSGGGVANSGYSPLVIENPEALFKEFTNAFNREYSKKGPLFKRGSFANGFTVYYLRQEIQSLADMYYATKNTNYLNTAKQLALKAINDATQNARPLLKNGHRSKKTWPCFYDEAVKQTGGHGQLYDFQFSAGLALLAEALEEADDPDVNTFTDFVENQIFAKWIGEATTDFYTLIAKLDSGRDKREHFASICITFDDLGLTQYPYKTWAEKLTTLYLTQRTSLTAKSPLHDELGTLDPIDWGIYTDPRTDVVNWFWVLHWRTPSLDPMDTSHANRTIWLACEAYDNNIIDKNTVNLMTKALKEKIWKPKKRDFYFTNYIDGSDRVIQRLGPGRKGNLWFGWHRLAQQDEQLKNLFIALADDIVNGGKNLPYGAQNKAMENAKLCFYAWAARLLTEDK